MLNIEDIICREDEHKLTVIGIVKEINTALKYNGDIIMTIEILYRDTTQGHREMGLKYLSKKASFLVRNTQDYDKWIGYVVHGFARPHGNQFFNNYLELEINNFYEIEKTDIRSKNPKTPSFIGKDSENQTVIEYQ